MLACSYHSLLTKINGQKHIHFPVFEQIATILLGSTHLGQIDNFAIAFFIHHC